jgi:ParB-like chromosome segregation protein Spo0J
MGAANNSSSSNTGQDLNGLPVPGGNGFAVSRDLNPKLTDVISLKPLGRETRKHPSAQLRKLQSSIEQFGIVLPVVVDAERRVVAGWGLVLAARKMGLLQVPAVTIDDLDEAKLRLLRLALNRLGEDSSWDFDALTLEFADILEIGIDVDVQLSGFEMGEIDVAFARGAGDEEDEASSDHAGDGAGHPFTAGRLCAVPQPPSPRLAHLSALSRRRDAERSYEKIFLRVESTMVDVG